MNTIAISCPEDTVSFLSSLNYGSYCLSVPCPYSLSNGGRQCDTNVPVMAEHSTDTFSLHFDQSCINHCLLKNEGSLIRTESCTNLWVCALKKQFDSMSF